MPSKNKCPKVKNPCKICLGAVTQKNGLQCCGACESWVHYGCLNYTPGRIKDIKAGIIQVTCPCPDCKTTIPKEFRTDEPFSCTNIQCPANMPPQCGNVSCPTNVPPMGGIMGARGAAEKMMQTLQSCPLGACGKDCKQHSTPNLPGLPAGLHLPTMPKQQPCMPQKGFGGAMQPMMSSSDACITDQKCASGCVAPSFPGDMSLPGSGGNSGLPSMVAMEQMCNTVTLLSKQIKEIMTKMQASQGGGGGGKCGNTGCSSKGQKSACPKPCYCPDNPGH